MSHRLHKLHRLWNCAGGDCLGTLPTLSLAKYLQMVGRGLRINKENKDKVCMIIDNVGNTGGTNIRLK